VGTNLGSIVGVHDHVDDGIDIAKIPTTGVYKSSAVEAEEADGNVMIPAI